MGEVTKDHAGSLFDPSQLDRDLLADASERIWSAIADENAASRTIDIIFDNSGYEVFSDLCLADFLVTAGLADRIRLYVKTIPWFISDVMTPDLRWLVQQLRGHRNETARILGQRWHDYLEKGAWTVEEHGFWTLPVPYSAMQRVDPALYDKLAEAKLVVFKGDLNYRKLFGEKNWDPTTPVEVALEGFHPAKLCTLRTLKADMICGLGQGVAEEAGAKDPDWLITGKYGVIQFCDRVGSS